MPIDPNDFIKKASFALAQLGWSAEDTFNKSGESHLVLANGDERKAWGMFDQIFCWSEAY